MPAEILTATFMSLRSRLHGLAASMLHSPDEADDVLHDAFLRLWDRGERDERQTAGSLVLAVRNACIDRLRRRARTSDMPAADTADDDAGARADAREEVERILRFVRSEVSAPAAEAFEMYVVDDLDYDEIARRMGITVGLARTYISRTRRRIRNQFSNQS